jgi:glycosyltransferase involved in cell wall biosynthesis/GT2 family glycosyltransferase
VVVFVSYSGLLGGAERILLEVAAALDGERCLACPEGVLAATARELGLRVFPLLAHPLELRTSRRERALAAGRLVAHAAEVRALIRRLHPELVIAWGMRSAIACLIAPRGRRRRAAATSPRGGRRRPAVAFHHHDLLPGPLIGALVRAAAARAERVVTLTSSAARELDPGGRLGARLTVIPAGVDLERFAPAGPPSQPSEVLVLGALVAWKRPELALEAVALARRRLPELRVRLAGARVGRSADLVTRLRARAAQPDLAGAVEFAGQLDDVPGALARASCLLHCAEREPYGLAVVEALAAGRPVVAPAAGGPAEIVDGGGGRLYRPGDARAAADALVEVLADPELAQRLGAEGRRRALASFDRATARARYRHLLQPRKSNQTATDLALITVTHNSADELAALLESVERHLPGAHVVVADCGSSDASVELACRAGRSARTTVLPLGENVGFGRACNRALSSVHESVVALVNPDVELLDGSLLELAKEASRADRPERLLAPLVLLPDGSAQDSVHPVPTSPPDLLRAVIPPALPPRPLAFPLAPWLARSPRRVGWAVGCCLVARTQTLRRLGPFDEQIFLFGEDLELGLRAAQNGVETWFWPDARVLHHRAHSTREAYGGEPFALLGSARHDVVERCLGRRRALLDDAAQLATFASRIAYKTAAGRPTTRERRQLASVAGGRHRERGSTSG